MDHKGEHIKFDKQTVLFGMFNSKGNKTPFANWLIINVKYYIYVSKMQKIKTVNLKNLTNIGHLVQIP